MATRNNCAQCNTAPQCLTLRCDKVHLPVFGYARGKTNQAMIEWAARPREDRARKDSAAEYEERPSSDANIAIVVKSDGRIRKAIVAVPDSQENALHPRFEDDDVANARDENHFVQHQTR
ncbi:uncharacterized protein ARMOST_18104 [Armillaria ostoyae]|uniref:Uncharacterized protein n=1 Tax=Armillaria ostoyae TaxID=47428 RepID=A0A284S0V3_ARMOS|nr:uncharacterized protein ARMOST_18104 [Armillaria ostoyae]